jgi:predicted nucleic acid-binding protein
VKLVVMEPESRPLAAELARWREHVSASISLTEVTRACRVAAGAGMDAAVAGQILAAAEAVLARIEMLDIDPPLLREAASLDPIGLRSLDAIHLATALSIRDELGAVVTYDRRLASAARAYNLEVLTPN